jgi:copper transport protein
MTEAQFAETSPSAAAIGRRAPRRGAGRWRRRAVLVAAGAVLAVTGIAGPASAHATLESTSPSQGSQVATAPARVSLRFGESVGFNSRSVEVLDSGGRRVDLGDPGHPGGDGSTVAVGLRAGLPRGSYAVVWHVVSADSHPVSGTFSFGIGVPAGAAPTAVADDQVVVWADGIMRFVAYAGAAVLLGGGFFLRALWPAGLRHRRPRRLLAGAWTASVVAAVGLLLLQGPYGAGLGLGQVADPGLIQETASSRFGQLMLLRLVTLGLAVAVFRRQGAVDDDGSWLDAAGMGLLLLPTFSLTGHAAQGSLAAVSVVADAAHLAAAGIWVGGLTVLVTCLARSGPAGPVAAGSAGGRETAGGNEAADRERLDISTLAQVLPRWSVVAMGCVAVLAGTGLFQAWREVGSWAALTGTGYGQLLLAKTAAFLVLLGLGNEGRRWVNGYARRSSAAAGGAAVGPAETAAGTRRPVTTAGTDSPGSAGAPSARTVVSSSAGALAGAGSPPVRLLRRTVAAEVAIAAAVLALTAVLVNGIPARQAYAPPYSATLTARNADGQAITVLVDVAPTRTGSQTVHLYTYTAAGVVLPYQSALADVTEPSAGLGPITFTFADTGPGHGTAEGIVVPAAGTWTLTLHVRTDATTDYATTTTYVVH